MHLLWGCGAAESGIVVSSFDLSLGVRGLLVAVAGRAGDRFLFFRCSD